MFGDVATVVIGAYRKSHPGQSPFDIFAAIMASGVRSAAFIQAIRKNKLRRAKAYEYIYTWRTPVLSGRPGTFHGAELAMVFNNAAFCDRYTGGGQDAIDLALKMSGAWAALAKNGSPQYQGLPDWSPYEANSKEVMIFDKESKIVRDPEEEGINLIERFSKE
jgi:para-nitrobenzyl esterase